MDSVEAVERAGQGREIGLFLNGAIWTVESGHPFDALDHVQPPFLLLANKRRRSSGGCKNCRSTVQYRLYRLYSTVRYCSSVSISLSRRGCTGTIGYRLQHCRWTRALGLVVAPAVSRHEGIQVLTVIWSS